MQLIELDYIKYSLCITNRYQSPLSDYYMNNNGRFFVLLENDDILAYAIVNDRKKDIIIIDYLFVPDEYKDTEYPTILIKKIREYFNLPMRADIIESNESFDAIKKYLEDNGFESSVLCREFRIDITKENIEKYRSRHFEKAAEYLKKNGFECLPFSQMNEDIENQLKQSFTNEFNNTFEVLQFFEDSRYTIDRDCSMVLIKDGRLRAYILGTRITNDCIRLEQAAEARQDIGSGIVIYPLLAFNEAIIDDKDLKKVNYSISLKNEESMALADSLIGFINKTSVNVISFVSTMTK
ncbi:MAG: hypothetical protein KBT27_12525 [Prevotellaceae bacterium]|nr:hypothetical protein [Candidatus Faecinaster equi]